MDQKGATILLESLIHPIERDSESGKWRLSGPISSQELESLTFALAELRGDKPSQKRSIQREAVTAHPTIVINLDSSKLEQPEDPEITLCLDFGTAMSKSFAIRSD